MAELLPSDELVEEPSDFGALAPGTRLGRYELLVPVARGGMARVWAARLHGQRGFQKVVALKTILPHLAREKQFERMFLDEARIASGVHHPNVCEIYELGEEQHTLYLAMEWVSGDSLARLLRASGAADPIDPRVAARVLADACAGVHAAHELTDEDGRELGVVHRDLSPHNILLTHDGHAKVADFGVAKALGQLHEATSAGQLKGKLAYMAPEQITGAPVDRRSDVFSLGCVLYEVTTGHRPFRGEGDHQVMHAVLKGEYAPPSTLVRGYPVELERIVQRALAAQPILRFPTAERMRFALEEFLARGQLVTTANVAQLLRARLGAALDKRKERIRLASTAEDRERGWSEPPAAGHTPSADASHRSGVKQATPRTLHAPVQPDNLDSPTKREHGRTHGVPGAVPNTGMGVPYTGQAMGVPHTGMPVPYTGQGARQTVPPTGHGMTGVPPTGHGMTGVPPTGHGMTGTSATYPAMSGVTPAGYHASTGTMPPAAPSTSSGWQPAAPYAMTPAHGATPFGAPPTFAANGPSSSAVPAISPSSVRGPAGPSEGAQGPASAGQYAAAIGIGVLVAGLIAGGAVYAWSRRPHPEPAKAAATAPAVAPSAGAMPSSLPAAADLAFDVTPESAVLVVDGRELAPSVRRIPRPPPGTTSTLVVRAKGKRDATRLVDYFTTSPTRIVLDDAPEPVATGAVTAAPAAAASTAAPAATDAPAARADRPPPKTDPKPVVTTAPPVATAPSPRPKPTPPKADPALPANPY